MFGVARVCLCSSHLIFINYENYETDRIGTIYAVMPVAQLGLAWYGPAHFIYGGAQRCDGFKSVVLTALVGSPDC